MSKLKVKVTALSAAQYKARLNARYNPPQMSQGEQAARLYLGKKQTDRAIKADRIILIVYGLFSIGALASPFIIFWGL